MSDSGDQLTEQGLAFLHQGDLKKAVAIGRQLEDAGHPAAPRLMALIHEHEGNLEEALAVLERGVSQFPDAWQLWEMLGNVHTQFDAFDDAQKAYLRALACPGAPVALHLNRAVAYLSNEDSGRAHKALDQVQDPDLVTAFRVAAMRARLHNQDGHYDDALDVLTAVANTVADPLDRDRAAYHAVRSEALLGLGRRQAALDEAWQTIALDPSDPLALHVIRLTTGETVERGKELLVTAAGTWQEGGEAVIYRSQFHLVAARPKDAARWIEPFLPEKGRDAIVIEKVETLGVVEDELTGVLGFSGHHFS